MTQSPLEYQRVHFVGIAGAGMSGLARYLLSRGIAVSGSDRSGSQVLDALGNAGADVHDMHDARWQEGAELVVISSAVPDENPEVASARARGVPVIKRAELLAAIMNPGYGIAVAGTHGKSGTSALIAHILTEAGLDPTVLIGAASANLGSNSRTGESDLVVVEADEYDASFLRLSPSAAVILNVEAEHLDFYGTEAAVFEAFRTFARSASDVLVFCADDPGARNVVRDASAPLVSYGIERGDWRARAIQGGPEGLTFEATLGSLHLAVSVRLSGTHNVRNTLAAIAVAHSLGVAPDTIVTALASFTGVQRRLELRGQADGAAIVDDYAHHPTEMRASLSALRQRYPDRRLLLVFQPHTYSRTESFFGDIADALADADRTYLTDIYAARERDTRGMHSRDLAAAAERRGGDVRYCGDLDSALRAVRRDLRADDLVVTMGAGDVSRVADALLQTENVSV